MNTLLETINEQYRPFGSATELTNGKVIGAYGNGNFLEYEKTSQGVKSFGYKCTESEVERVFFPNPYKDNLLKLNMYHGRLVQNKSFAFTDYGILSFITGKIVETPYPWNYSTEQWNPDCQVEEDERNEPGKVYLIMKGKKYYFDGITFVEQ